MILYKSKIQCPNCEGCGKMIKQHKSENNKSKTETTLCKICNGNGFIVGNIKVLVNEEDD